MDLLKIRTVILFCCFPLLSACQIPYLIKSAYYQLDMLSDRVPIDKALDDEKLSESEKNKLRLAQKAREFAESDLHLKSTKNYTSFVKLDRPYVTYVVSASPKWELTHYLWWYPIVGSMPYKGFFKESEAKDEEKDLQKKDLDTYMRGVSAYSTLGWFRDPLLSSMLHYDDQDLVNTIIHETVHATIFIKHEADFNERLAVFLGNKGTELFYLKQEGADSPTLKKIREDNHDDKLFSEFISVEIENLKNWYTQLPQSERKEELRQKRIQEIQSRFKTEVLPKMQSKGYERFVNTELNNAKLLVYKTYMQDLSDFEVLFSKSGGSVEKFIENCRQLENSEDPNADLKKLIQTL